MPARTALITGSTGFIGSHLTEELLRRGFKVKVFIRKSSDLKFINDLPVEKITVHYEHLDSSKEAVSDVSHVFHLASVVRGNNYRFFHKINVDITNRMLAFCRENCPRLELFVYVGSQAAHGPCDNPAGRDENDRPVPVSCYGLSKLRAEKNVLDHAGSLPVCIILPSAVYGPRDTDFLHFVKMVKSGFALINTLKDKYMSMIHVSDLVKGICLAIENPEARGKVFFISDGNVYPRRTILDAIADILNKKYRKVILPDFMLSFICWLSSGLGIALKRVFPINLDKVKEMFARYWVVKANRFFEITGFKPEYDIYSGLKDTIEWYEKNQWI